MQQWKNFGPELDAHLYDTVLCTGQWLKRYVRSNARSPDSDVWPPKGSLGQRELRQRDVGHFCLPVTLKYLQGDNGGIYNVHIYLTFLCNFLIDLLLQLIMTYACHKCNR